MVSFSEPKITSSVKFFGVISATFHKNQTRLEFVRVVISPQVALLYMCSRLIVNLSQVYLPMYLTSSLKLDKVGTSRCLCVRACVRASVYCESLFLSLSVLNHSPK